MTENYINNNFNLTLATAVNNTNTTLIVSSAVTVDGGFRILIESELLSVTSGGLTTSWTVVRGIEGTTGNAHGATVSINIVLSAGALLNLGSGHTTILPMSYQAITGTWAMYYNVNIWSGYEFYNSSVANGDSVSYKTYLANGTYTFFVYGDTAPDAGKLDISFNSVVVGTIDQYNGSVVYNTNQSITGIAATGGLTTISITVNGHNTSSSGYIARIIYLALWRTA